jgi:hypothetical protein
MRSVNVNTLFQATLFPLVDVVPSQHLYIREPDRRLPRSVGCSLQGDEYEVVDIQVAGSDLPNWVGAPFHLHLLCRGS